ncbi:hypothetical protein [Streptomyces sp. NPDC002328]|uniref:hypothetical protein n=1 Tax=Streptomyces sp. NPDC002328 TaxID=3364642 RepID=UPI00369F3D89
MELLSELIDADRLGAAPGAGPRLAEACGGLPFALNLAGRRIAARPGWLLDEAVNELIGDGEAGGTEPARFLRRLRAGDDSLHQRIEEAYRGLAPGTRQVLRQCATSAARVSAHTLVHEVADGLDRPEAPAAELFDELLDDLMETGLLEPSQLPGEYGMPPLVRAFALIQPDPTSTRNADRGTDTGTGTGRLSARRYDRGQERPHRLVPA